ncbi:MAG: glycosyltransferase [Lachnospiraceae bacterium]|nr:glycosyltransferase [Lachnospiraceae bacterium]
MSEMKVDILIPYSGQGGVEMVVNQTALFLISKGCKVRVIQMVWDGTPWLNASIDFYPLRRERVQDIEQFTDLYGVFLESNGMPDAVLATPWPFLAYVARRALKVLGREADCRIISWLHAPVEIYEKYGVGGMERLAFADKVFCLTKAEEQRINNMLGVGKATMIYNPIDSEKLSGVSEVHNENRTGHTLLYVGRLSEEKGVDILLRAIACTKFPWELVLIGDGKDRSRLEEIGDMLEVSHRVKWLGWQEKPWAYGIRNGAEFLALASEYEGFALVIAEALAAGIPVISTPVGIAPELIRPGENGYLYETGQVSQLVEILDYIADNKLPVPDRETCVGSVKSFEQQSAMEDFWNKISEE